MIHLHLVSTSERVILSSLIEYSLFYQLILFFTCESLKGENNERASEFQTKFLAQ